MNGTRKRLTVERETLGWSKAELARRCVPPMNQATVGQIESGYINPRPSQLEKLAAALGWTGEPAELMEILPEECD